MQKILLVSVLFINCGFFFFCVFFIFAIEDNLSFTYLVLICYLDKEDAMQFTTMLMVLNQSVFLGSLF